MTTPPRARSRALIVLSVALFHLVSNAGCVHLKVVRAEGSAEERPRTISITRMSATRSGAYSARESNLLLSGCLAAAFSSGTEAKEGYYVRAAIDDPEHPRARAKTDPKFYQQLGKMIDAEAFIAGEGILSRTSAKLFSVSMRLVKAASGTILAKADLDFFDGEDALTAGGRACSALLARSTPAAPFDRSIVGSSALVLRPSSQRPAIKIVGLLSSPITIFPKVGTSIAEGCKQAIGEKHLQAIDGIMPRPMLAQGSDGQPFYRQLGKQTTADTFFLSTFTVDEGRRDVGLLITWLVDAESGRIVASAVSEGSGYTDPVVAGRRACLAMLGDSR